MLFRRRHPWDIPERETTPEPLFLTRRSLIASIAAAAVSACAEGRDESVRRTIPQTETTAVVNRGFTGGRPTTDEIVAASYNNFYEFSPVKDRVWKLAENLDTRGWTVEVAGLVQKPLTFDVDALHRLSGPEERVYRLRCVEAWAMVVPWIGIPLHRLLGAAQPLSRARYVRFETFMRPFEAEGQRRQPAVHWPYVEALRVDEAMHELTMQVTGVYGHALPKQHGAPIRVVVPWKYGFKSAKSLVKIELTDERPATFWNTQAPAEYSFEANVDPSVPHPRWSQKSERLIGTWDVRRTEKYNGYGEAVAGLYGVEES